MEWRNLDETFITIRNGKNIKQHGTNGYPITRIETIADRYIDEARVGYADIYNLEGYEDYILQKGDILMSHINSVKHLAKTAIFNSESVIIHGMNLLCLRADKTILNPYYGFHYLNSDIFLNQIPQITKNSVNQASFNITNLKRLKIPVPPMDIQRKIVEVLDEAQSLIDKRKEQIDLLDDLIESIFYDMFGDPVKNDKGWKVKKLGELIEVNPKKSEISGIKDSDLEISFVPMENVLEDGKLILEETRKISDVYKGYTYFKEDDILFAKITPCMENGKGCIAKGLLNNIGFGSTEFHVLRPKNNLLAKEYVFHLSKSKKFRKEAENKMTGSAGQKRVPKKFIEDYFINVPPLLLQNQFAEKVEAIEKQKELMEESLKLMEDNYNSIMQRAFKGELF